MAKSKKAALYQYWIRYDRGFHLSDWLAHKASGAMLYSRNDWKSVFMSAKLLLLGLSAMAAEMAETSRKRKKLCAILGCLPEEIAMDVDELAQKRESVKYYGGDFTYKAPIARDWMKNIRIIFGDTHLEALDDMACLGSLKSVYGGVYVSGRTDLGGMKQLSLIGKGIFCQDRRFSSLEEFEAR